MSNRPAATRKAEVRLLGNHLEHTIAIECASCGNGTNALATTEWAAMNELYGEGWRVVQFDASDETRCPECVKAGKRG